MKGRVLFLLISWWCVKGGVIRHPFLLSATGGKFFIVDIASYNNRSKSGTRAHALYALFSHFCYVGNFGDPGDPVVPTLRGVSGDVMTVYAY